MPVELARPVRRYPGSYPVRSALYHTLCRQGKEPPVNSPIARAACREANAQDLDRDAARATTPEARATVQAAADDELARARTILADAARRHVKGTEPGSRAGRRDA